MASLEVTSATNSLSADGAKDEDTKSMLATIGVLLTGAASSKVPFIPSSHAVIPLQSETLPKEATSFLHDLALAAHATATSLQCSSILAGRASESDDYGDVTFWAGKADLERKEEGVLLALGLDKFLEIGEIVPEETDGNYPLASLNAVPEEQVTAAKEVVKFLSLLAQLEDPFEFRVELPENREGATLHFLVGTWKGERCGLIGASVQLE